MSAGSFGSKTALSDIAAAGCSDVSHTARNAQAESCVDGRLRGHDVKKAVVASLLLSLAFAGAALAVEPDEILPDQALEARARGISAGLRCLVCQNQSIDDSNAPLARDLRLLVRERLKAGDSDTQVVRFVEDRYGEFVLLNPPLSWRTVVLWAAPPLALLIAVWVSVRGWRRRQSQSAAADAGLGPLTPDEETRLRKILADGADEPPKA